MKIKPVLGRKCLSSVYTIEKLQSRNKRFKLLPLRTIQKLHMKIVEGKRKLRHEQKFMN